MTLPRYAALLGATLDTDDSGGGPASGKTVGVPVLAMPSDPGVLGRPGFLHGGAIAGLLEVAGRAALDHALAESGVVATVEPLAVTVDYRRGGRAVTSRAVGTVMRLGTRIASVEAIMWQDDRAAPIASARLTYLLARD